jgi:putative oxidoreductase
MKTIGNRQALGLAIIRIIVGVVFMAHGAQKMFVYGHAGVTGAMTQMGIPLPALSAYLITFTELFGGLALVFGLLTRVAALPIAFSMLVAITQVHFKAGLFLPNGYEFALTMLAANIGLAVAGGGAFALDNVLFKVKAAREPELLRAAA